jgi:hypothetical protein
MYDPVDGCMVTCFQLFAFLTGLLIGIVQELMNRPRRG